MKCPAMRLRRQRLEGIGYRSRTQTARRFAGDAQIAPEIARFDTPALPREAQSRMLSSYINRLAHSSS